MHSLDYSIQVMTEVLRGLSGVSPLLRELYCRRRVAPCIRDGRWHNSSGLSLRLLDAQTRTPKNCQFCKWDARLIDRMASAAIFLSRKPDGQAPI